MDFLNYWQDVSNAPEDTELLVTATYSDGLGGWRTDRWVDWFQWHNGNRRWFVFPQLTYVGASPREYIVLNELLSRPPADLEVRH